jgi:hypothetical protein
VAVCAVVINTLGIERVPRIRILKVVKFRKALNIICGGESPLCVIVFILITALNITLIQGERMERDKCF